MTLMLERAVMNLCGLLPRGGYQLALAARRYLPGLAHYPARLRFGDIVLKGDVAHNVFYPLVLRGYYAHQTVEDDVLALIARGSGVIVDVGGNIGYTAALMAVFAPEACILVFEPLRLCKPYLDRIAARFPRVTIVAKAVGAAPGTARFLLRPQIDRSSLTTADEAAPEAVDVEVTTLDAELGDQHVDVVKIDVEGFEHEVLAGARATIQRCRPIVVFEAYETEVLRSCVAFFLSLELGYRIFAITHSGELRALAKPERQADETCNFVAWPPQRKLPPDLAVPRCYKRPAHHIR